AGRLASNNWAEGRPNVGSPSATSISKQVSTTQAITRPHRRATHSSIPPWCEKQTENVGQNPASPLRRQAGELLPADILPVVTNSIIGAREPHPFFSLSQSPFQSRSCDWNMDQQRLKCNLMIGTKITPQRESKSFPAGLWFRTGRRHHSPQGI